MTGLKDGSACVSFRSEKVQKGDKRCKKVGKGEAEFPKKRVCNSGIAFFSRKNLGERRRSVTFGYRRASLCYDGSRVEMT